MEAHGDARLCQYFCSPCSRESLDASAHYIDSVIPHYLSFSPRIPPPHSSLFPEHISPPLV